MGTLALFKESGVKLLDQLPSDSRTEELLGNLLEEKKLLFLVPLLAIKSELWRQLETNPSLEAYLAWIQANVHPEHHTDPAFVYALMSNLLKHIHQQAANGDKEDTEAEKELILKFKPQGVRAVLQQATAVRHLRSASVLLLAAVPQGFAAAVVRGALRGGYY